METINLTNNCDNWLLGLLASSEVDVMETGRTSQQERSCRAFSFFGS